MELKIVVPTGTDIDIIEQRYDELIMCCEEDEGEDVYLLGESVDDVEFWGDDEDPWPYESCVEACGFIEGAIPEAYTRIEGNGPWAQGLLRVKDFGAYHLTAKDREEWERNSEIWHTAFNEGLEAAKKEKMKRRKARKQRSNKTMNNNNENNSKLLPCPKCGGRAAFPAYAVSPWEIYAFCKDCGYEGDIEDTDKKAIDAWNREAAAASSPSSTSSASSQPNQQEQPS